MSNFGAFASPERRLVFDVNDFDETLPGPFEWDVKRLAASLSVAGRDNGFPAKARRGIVLAAAEGYRTAMRGFAEQSLLDVWYAHLDVEQAIGEFRSQIKAKRLKAGEAMLAKAHTRDSMQALGKLTTMVDGRRRIITQPPMIVPVRSTPRSIAGMSPRGRPGRQCYDGLRQRKVTGWTGRTGWPNGSRRTAITWPRSPTGCSVRRPRPRTRCRRPGCG